MSVKESAQKITNVKIDEFNSSEEEDVSDVVNPVSVSKRVMAIDRPVVPKIPPPPVKLTEYTNKWTWR